MDPTTAGLALLILGAALIGGEVHALAHHWNPPTGQRP